MARVLVCVRLEEVGVEFGRRVLHGSHADVRAGLARGGRAVGAHDFVFDLQLLELLLEGFVFGEEVARGRFELGKLRFELFDVAFFALAEGALAGKC